MPRAMTRSSSTGSAIVGHAMHCLCRCLDLRLTSRPGSGRLGDWYDETVQISEAGDVLAIDMLEAGASREELRGALEKRRPSNRPVSDPE